MPTLTQTHLTAAEHLLRRARRGDETQSAAEDAARVYELLFRQLAPVLGSASVRALLARSIKVNRAAFPDLTHIVLPAEPSDQSAQIGRTIVRALAPLAPERQRAIATSLYATFLALLATLIGERLTWRILQTTLDDDDGPASKETE